MTATRTETRVADTPASVVVLSRDVIATTAAATLDDALRQVPGFTLFRRTGSRVANPTTQGLSLRGIGPSGASRALVIEDGVPLNDPFGGWVYWGRVPRPAVERVEVVRGGGSELYGSSAMGGVVQFIRRRPRQGAVSAEISGGSQSSGNASLFASAAKDVWRGAVSLDLFDTGGYTLVAPEDRGPVDRAADSSHRAIDVTAARHSLFLRLSHYDEERNNGTPLQVNDTTIRQLSAGAGIPAWGGSVQVRGWLSDQDYRQTFSAIGAGRATERLTVDQRVPSRGSGMSAQLARPVGARHALLAGVEARQVTGASDEGTTRVEGKQRTASAFLEDIFVVTPGLSITAGVRFDGWRNFDAERDGAVLASRGHWAWSPRVAALLRRGPVAFSASAYSAFRAPTLNELYRNFRVGNVVTSANPALTAERLDAIELGARGRNLRATLFWMSLDDVVANVTLSATPALITRQRQNVAASRSRGLELEGDWRLGNRWRVSSGYLLSDASVTSGALDGKRLPQVPRHQATGQVLFSSLLTAGLQARWSGSQFDDDLNELPLRSFFVADVFLSRGLGERVEVILAAENIFDERVEASATPVITLGQPRSIRLGFRYER